ncbi:MAG TPA: serine hydroxymethyltransferase [Patescibacteria group bacterium]|nr:serine hydroxymethyltransferase [Patescibacteria group bacterium]
MNSLQKTDPKIAELIHQEEIRQRDVLEMIPSENYTSKAVLEALGSVLNNKYSEGFPKKRYYQGNKIADEVEILAADRAKEIFGVPYANMQALSGSPANTAIYFALLKNGDKMMGLDIASGGHITHGNELGITGRLFKTVHYSLGKDNLLDYDAIEEQVKKEKPDLLICGFTAYPRIIDFKRFGEIADSVGAYLMADISHITGLIIGGVHPSPVPYTHIIMTTTHKTLRGPRGAIIMVTDKGLAKNPDMPKKLESAIIPGLQGGPHDNQTAAIAVALLEASKPEFKTYAEQIVKNAKALAENLSKNGIELVSGGTDNHLLLIDLRNKSVNGAVGAFALEVANIVTNKNGVPGDTMPPFYPSGIRLGTPAITTRGLKEADMEKVANWITRVIEAVKDKKLPENKEERTKYFRELKKELATDKTLLTIGEEVKEFASKLPLP